MICVLAAMLALIVSPASGAAKAVATVNGQPLTAAQVAALVPGPVDAMSVSRAVDYVLLDQAARRQHIVIAASEVNLHVQQIRQSLGGQPLAEALRQHGMTQAMLDAQLRHALILKALAERHLPLPPKLCHVRWLLLGPGARVTLAHVQSQLKAGASFTALSRRDSTDAATRASGGDLGVLTPSAPLNPRVVAAAFTLKPGQITPTPIRTAQGLCLLQGISVSAHPHSSDSAQYARLQGEYRTFWLDRLMPATLARLRGQAKIVMKPLSPSNGEPPVSSAVSAGNPLPLPHPSAPAADPPPPAPSPGTAAAPSSAHP